jgi:TRAP-type C4-dicarboxylate transport system permease small subunit
VVQKFIDLTCRGLSVVMVACLALMVLMVFGNVVLRYGFNTGITMSEELSRWLFVWMTFCGALVALRRHAHLGTDTLVSRLPPGGKKACFGITLLLMLFVSWLMLRGAWSQTVINWGSTSAVMEASMGYFYASGLFFAAFAILFLLHELWKLLTGRLAENELIGVTESDDMPHGNPQATTDGHRQP